MAGANRFNVGSSKPWDVQEGVKQLLERFYDLSQRLANIGHTAARVANQFQTLEHMVGRFSASLMLTLGVPRALRSDLYHAVAGGTGGGRGGGEGTGGGRAGYPGPKSLDDWRDHFDKKYQADTEERVKWAKVAKEQIDEIYGRTKDKTKAIDPEALGKKILDKESEVATKEQLLERLKERASSETNPEEKRKLRNRELKLSGTLTLLKAELTKLQEQKGGLPTPPGAPPPSQGGTPSGGGGFDWGGAWKGVKGAWGSLKEAADKVSYAFLGLAAGAQSLLRAASPDLFSTFTGSIQLLASEIGSTLMPLFIELSYRIQGWAAKFSQWEEGTKESIGKFLAAGLAITGVITGLKLLGTALAALLSPIGMVATALAGVGMGVWGVMEKRQSDEEHEAKVRQALKTTATLENMKREGLEKLILPEEATEGERKKRIAEIDAWVKGSQRRFEALSQERRERAPGTITQFFRGIPTFGLRDWVGSKFGAPSDAEVEEMLKGLDQRREDEGRRSGILRSYQDILRGKGRLESRATPEDVQRDMGAYRGLLLNFQSFRALARYSSVEEAYKNVQIEAIGKSPLEQALDRQLGQRLDQLLKEAQKANLLTEQQAQETRQMMGRN